MPRGLYTAAAFSSDIAETSMVIARRTAFALGAGAVLILAGVAYYMGAMSAGTLVVQVRDAPADWAHLNVTFTEVRVHRADAGNESGWVSLSLEARTIDFLALGNLTQVLALDRIPAGKYTQIRVVVASVEGTPARGAKVSLSVPDGILRTTTPFDLPGGGTATVTLDFDLSRSIVSNANGYTFKPVLGSVLIN